MTDEPINASSSTFRDPAQSASTSGADYAERSFRDDAVDDGLGSGDAFSEAQFALQLGKEWVRQHQTVAMIGAFAVGAFVGALMRD